MIRKVSAELKRNRSLMSQHMTPNIVKYVEFEKPGRAKNMLSRVLITKARDGTYSVGIIRVGHKLDRYACSYTPDISRHQQKYFAEEKLEELSLLCFLYRSALNSDTAFSTPTALSSKIPDR